MAQSTMYPAMAGSPKTALSTNLAADGTTAYVDNLEKLPAAPNVVTFWITEDTWERCVYSAKSAETGPGTITIARSGTGHASSAGNAGLEWAAGTKVARNPGELDHTLFKANIEDLETRKITASGVTYENLAANSDIGTGATQVAQGNHTHTPASIGAASGSTTTKTLYVYGDATGTGDGSTKANGFTTLSACLAAMPDVINHAYVIKMCAASAAYVATTVQKIVGAGSITIEGEFYRNGTVASAGSTVGKFNTQAGDTGAASGDKILMIKYSGTVGASTPSDAFIDTVAGVSGTEITLTTRTTDAFDTTWRYVIVRTEMAGLKLMSTNNITLGGLFLNASSGNYVLDVDTCNMVNVNSLVAMCGGTCHGLRVFCSSGANTTGYSYGWKNFGLAKTSVSASYILATISADSTLTLGDSVILDATETNNEYTGVVSGGTFSFMRGMRKNTGSGISRGFQCMDGGNTYVYLSLLQGSAAGTPMPIALTALRGGFVRNLSNTFTDVTTQKSPANWAASTDGSYIS